MRSGLQQPLIQCCAIPWSRMSAKFMANTGAASKEELVDDDLKPTRKSKIFVYTLTILSTLGGFLFGYDTGVVSGAMLLIKNDFTEISDLWHELIVSSTVAAALVFSLCGGWCADRYGRKPTILLSGVLFITGSIILGVSPNKEVLLVGRLIVGMAIGFESMSVPVYLAECADPSMRGMLVTIYQLLITLGMLFANIVGGIFADVDHGWRYMLGLAAVPSLLQLVGFLLMPESPRWLSSKKRNNDALKVLCTIRGSEKAAEQEVANMRESFEEREKEVERQEAISGGRSVLFMVFSSRRIRRALFVGCSLNFLQQLIGVNTVMYYSATIIQMAGVRDESLAIWLSAVTAAVNSLCTFIGIYLVERIGRRKLVLFSLVGIIISCILLGVGFELMKSESPLVTVKGDGSCAALSSCYDCIDKSSCGFCFMEGSDGSVSDGSCWALNSTNSKPNSGPCAAQNKLKSITSSTVLASGWCPNKYAWLTILAMAMYLVSFSPGMGPMPWTINAEIYPLWARGICTSLSTSFNWAGNLIISSTFLSLMEALSKAGAFYLYMGIATFTLILMWCTLPETGGCTLEELETVFDGELFSIRGRGNSNNIRRNRNLAGVNNNQKVGDNDYKNGLDIKIQTVSDSM